MSNDEANGLEGRNIYRENLKQPWARMVGEKAIPNRFDDTATSNGFEIALYVSDPVLQQKAQGGQRGWMKIKTSTKMLVE